MLAIVAGALRVGVAVAERQIGEVPARRQARTVVPPPGGGDGAGFAAGEAAAVGPPLGQPAPGL